jgi:hypothetical protein
MMAMALAMALMAIFSPIAAYTAYSFGLFVQIPALWCVGGCTRGEDNPAP